MKLFIIGAGGVGSWLLPSICMLTRVNEGEVTVVDGDTLETKNLNRQLFTEKDVGKNKADALAKKYGCRSIPKYYAHNAFDVEEKDWLLVCADNNPARASALETCDTKGCKLIVGANEVTSAEAYYYDPQWQGTMMDARIYYPEIKTDTRFDPLTAGSGCTGVAQEDNKQLVTANFMAAALMQHLFILWQVERRKFTRETIPHIPYRIRQNLTKYELVKAIDHQNQG
jgi:molybdopterin/thiamine biosynthesis adenylyltransferase